MLSDTGPSIQQPVQRRLLYRRKRPEANEPGTYALRSLHALLTRRARLIVVCFTVVFGAVATFALLQPRRYEAEVRLLLAPDAPSPASNTAPGRTVLTDAEMAAAVELFRSRDVLGSVVEQCGLALPASIDPDVQRRAADKAARTLDKAMRVAPIRKTNLVAVRVRWREPRQAADVANALVAAWLLKRTSVQRNDRAAEFFANEAAKRRAQLEEAQHALAAFQRQHGIAALDAEKSALNSRIAELENQIVHAEPEIRETRQRRELLRRQMEGLPPTLETSSRVATSSPVVDRLKEKLAELETQRASLLQKYAPGYRLVLDVEEQIRQTRESLAREQAPAVVDRTESLNPLRQSTESELLRADVQIQGAEVRLQSLQAALRESRQRSEELEGLTGEYQRLVRAVEQADQRDALYRNKEADLRLAQDMDDQQVADVAIIEAATPPTVPARSNRNLFLMLGLMAAFSASMSAVFVSEAIDRPVRDAKDLTEISGLPVLATLSKGMGPCR
jgi:uncharacterized protein involved in exopolysaccharide biosynthesis